MTTYKVLLVDDEEEVRNAIEQRISWEELGFEVIGKAQNGVKAMEIAEKLQPDVVITDIKMPYMNGLELARNLKEENPGVRILILTGFDEFEYAKEAVHLEIEEYILKPVNANELSECLKRLKNVLDKEREEKLIPEITSPKKDTIIFEEEQQKTSKKEFNLFENIDNSDTYVTYYVYIVKEQDTIDSIMKKYNIDKESISLYNNLEEIKPGMKLIIPNKNE